jgi:hypothetical protein
MLMNWLTENKSAEAATAVAATTPCLDETKKRQRYNPVSNSTQATTTTKKARRDDDDEDDDDEMIDMDEDLETSDDDDDLEDDDEDDEDGDDDLGDDHEEVKDDDAAVAKEAKEQQQILDDSKTIFPQRLKELVSLIRRTPNATLRSWIAKAKFNEIKRDWLPYLAALVLLHFPKSDKNHFKAWRDEVFEILRACGMTQKSVVVSPKRLKRMVLDKFPALMEERGIFGSMDQSRVIGRHDNDTLPSQQARLEHIKKLATMMELSWIGDKSANGLLTSIEILKNACDLLGALRHGDFHKDWNAPKGAAFAALLFSKKTLIKLVEEKSANSRQKRHRNRKFGEIGNFCFDAGEFAANTWFFDKDRKIIGDARVAQLRGLFE